MCNSGLRTVGTGCSPRDTATLLLEDLLNPANLPLDHLSPSRINRDDTILPSSSQLLPFFGRTWVRYGHYSHYRPQSIICGVGDATSRIRAVTL